LLSVLTPFSLSLSLFLGQLSLEKVEMKLIQKLRNTQQLQQQAFHELESALNGDV
jgi:hypothetical protein